MVELLTLLLPALLLVGLWFIMVRPVRQRQREALQAQQAVQIGSEVMTTAGIYGRVVSVEADTIGLEISDGVVVKYARAAVASVQTDDVAREE